MRASFYRHGVSPESLEYIVSNFIYSHLLKELRWYWHIIWKMPFKRKQDRIKQSAGQMVVFGGLCLEIPTWDPHAKEVFNLSR